MVKAIKSAGKFASGEELDGDPLGADPCERHAGFHHVHVAVDFEFKGDNGVGVDVFSTADQVSQRMFAPRLGPIAAGCSVPV